MKCNCAGKWIDLQFIEKFVVTSATYNCPTTRTSIWIEWGKKSVVISFNLRFERKKEKNESICVSVCGNLTLFGNFATISFGKYWRMVSRNTAYSTTHSMAMGNGTAYILHNRIRQKTERTKSEKKHSMAKPIKQFDRLFQKQKPRHSEEKNGSFVGRHRWFSWDAISHRRKTQKKI